MLMKENKQLCKSLTNALNKLAEGTDYKSIFSSLNLSNMMQALLNCAIANANKKPNGRNYNDVLNELGTFIFLSTGPQTYSLLSKNLPLPCLSKVKGNVHSTETIIEGKFRWSALKTYLEERNYPMVVSLSEDATRIAPRIQYDSKGNQIVGFTLPFDDKGFPIFSNFPATSAARIAEYFNSGDTSNYVYAIVAQPLAENSSPFVLCLFGTNNKFSATDVITRWNSTENVAETEGILVVSEAGDGDSRLMKCMIFRTLGPLGQRPPWKWFLGPKKVNVFCVQDHIHVGTKLKSRLFKPSIILPVGNERVISSGHLKELLRSPTVSSDQHGLKKSYLDMKDKMNFKAVQKISDKKVTDLLTIHVPHSEGTATYLEMIRDVIDAYMHVELTPLKRVELIWEWTFFLRIWRQYILDSEGYTLQHNFITYNTYMCIEINAHSLVQAIVMLREKEMHEYFMPWLWSSQPCESTFRKFRSTTVTRCGVVSFSVLELLSRVKRIDYISNSRVKLRDHVVFPEPSKLHKKTETIGKHCHIPIALPEDYEVEWSVEAALQRAIERAVKLKLLPKKPPSSFVPVPNLKIPSDPTRDAATSNFDEDDESLQESDDEDDISSTGQSDEETSNEDKNSEWDGDIPFQHEKDKEMDDIAADLYIVSAGKIGVKTFNNVSLSEDSPFVLVGDGFKVPQIIHKSSYCWILSSGYTKISSDRMLRVQASLVSHRNTSISALQEPSKEETVHIGDWCAFLSEDNISVDIGRILAFSYLVGQTWSKQHLKQDSAKVNQPSNARKIGCLCTWFKVTRNSELKATSMDIHGYYDLQTYICTIPRPTYDDKQRLKISCTIAQIKKFSK